MNKSKHINTNNEELSPERIKEVNNTVNNTTDHIPEVKKEINKIMKTLKTRGWKSPNEVDEFFNNSLMKIATKAREEAIRECVDMCIQFEKNRWEKGEVKGFLDLKEALLKIKPTTNE